MLLSRQLDPLPQVFRASEWGEYGEEKVQGVTGECRPRVEGEGGTIDWRAEYVRAFWLLLAVLQSESSKLKFFGRRPLDKRAFVSDARIGPDSLHGVARHAAAPLHRRR